MPRRRRPPIPSSPPSDPPKAKKEEETNEEEKKEREDESAVSAGVAVRLSFAQTATATVAGDAQSPPETTHVGGREETKKNEREGEGGRRRRSLPSPVKRLPQQPVKGKEAPRGAHGLKPKLSRSVVDTRTTPRAAAGEEAQVHVELQNGGKERGHEPIEQPQSRLESKEAPPAQPHDAQAEHRGEEELRGGGGGDEARRRLHSRQEEPPTAQPQGALNELTESLPTREKEQPLVQPQSARARVLEPLSNREQEQPIAQSQGASSGGAKAEVRGDLLEGPIHTVALPPALHLQRVAMFGLSSDAQPATFPFFAATRATAKAQAAASSSPRTRPAARACCGQKSCTSRTAAATVSA